ncbi:SusD/RagB family nutrient-binding outer membrane lipoprotein [Dysgonomonas sp. 511]|uniref:SusD/RagB family nutrient-binding outer membrane lipoprotein n=1 Tax=Dysgonomonas sp. 511 TaxID=2302930 RepID=UPI0013D7C944|nr:SusD/RagB family nutrient-binding outer membrane lipoprotein [Dysgonomonas sp. 511]NDV78718.1 SusD/RagB family nutrient-binding outer membrane lipoprotein [Dysgonomonas sp. 511]
MNIIKNIKWLALAAIVGLTACIDEDLNKDPNTNPDMDPNLQITTIQVLPTSDPEAWHRYLIYPGGFINQWSNDWSLVEYGGKGKKNDSFFAQLWESMYPSVIKNVVDLVERTRDKPEYVNAHAAGRIMRVENFLRLTDYYGDIPYFEAGMAYYSGAFKPAYDRQEDIYKDFFKELKEAAGQFNSSAESIAGGDMYYSGDLEKWRKLANSLRLRIAMRLIKVDPALAKQEAEAAVADGVFTSNSDICYVMHDDVGGTGPSGGNAIANRFLNANSSTFRISKQLIAAMEKTQDPRIPYYAGSYLEDNVRTDITPLLYKAYGKYETFAIGAELFSWDERATVPNNPVSLTLDNGTIISVERLYQFMQPSKIISNPATPYIHMSYAEVELLLAEAAFRGYNVGGSAASHFQAGLKAAVEQWSLFGVSPDQTALQAFLNTNTLKTGTEMEQIATQLWILSFLDPFETWSNYRRLGLPREANFLNNYPTENESKGESPRRMQYPVSEQTSNPEGYQSAIDRLESKTDTWNERVWWDKK